VQKFKSKRHEKNPRYSNATVVLLDKHAIAITEKPVTLRYRMGIRTQNVIGPRKGAYEHKQGRFRQVKIGHQGINNPEAIPGVDKHIRHP
jgi:hypothetical protein